MKLIYPALFYEDNETHTFTVIFPDLPGCVTQGDTIEEALEMAEDAASGWILTSIEDDEEVPKPSKDYKKFNDEEGFLIFVPLNIEEYAKKHSNKSVKKTLTIPQWLNTLAEKENINFSQLLQIALKKELGLVSNSDYKNETILQVDQSIVTRLEENVKKIEKYLSQTSEISKVSQTTTNIIKMNRETTIPNLQ